METLAYEATATATFQQLQHKDKQWHLHKKKAEKQSAHSDRVTSVAFSPDGTTIVSGSNDKTIKVQTLIVWSPEPDTMVFPSGEKATEKM